MEDKGAFHRILFTSVKYLSAITIAITVLSLAVINYLYKSFRGTWTKTVFERPPPVLQDKKFGTHNYIKLKDIKLHYVEKGNKNKPLLLCLHGFPEFWYSWRHQLTALSDDYWVVAIDMRGYGDSDRPSGKANYKLQLLIDDIEQVIEGLGKRSCYLMSHDWGGMVAWCVTIAKPELVDKLIVLNCPHPGAFVKYLDQSLIQQLRSWYITFFQVPWLPELWMTLSPNLFDKAFGQSETSKQRITPTDIEAFKYTFSSKGSWTGPVNYYRANLGRTSKENYDTKIQVPTLVVWGAKDSYLSLALAVESGNFVDRYTLRVVDEGTHWVQQDHPEVVNRHIEEFLSRSSD